MEVCTGRKQIQVSHCTRRFANCWKPFSRARKTTGFTGGRLFSPADIVLISGLFSFLTFCLYESWTVKHEAASGIPDCVPQCSFPWKSAVSFFLPIRGLFLSGASDFYVENVSTRIEFIINKFYHGFSECRICYGLTLPVRIIIPGFFRKSIITQSFKMSFFHYCPDFAFPFASKFTQKTA